MARKTRYGLLTRILQRFGMAINSKEAFATFMECSGLQVKGPEKKQVTLVKKQKVKKLGGSTGILYRLEAMGGSSINVSLN